MELRELYAAIGVDYDEVIAFFRKEDRLQAYLVEAVEDPAFSALDEAMDSRSYDEAFRAAHTIKGMSMNLMVKPMTAAAVDLVETLRDGNPDDAEALARYHDFKTVSDRVISLVRNLS